MKFRLTNAGIRSLTEYVEALKEEQFDVTREIINKEYDDYEMVEKITYGYFIKIDSISELVLVEILLKEVYRNNQQYVGIILKENDDNQLELLIYDDYLE